jgi:methyl-accepting chemotaxis protein
LLNVSIKNLARSFVLTLMLVGGVSIIGELIIFTNISSVQKTWDKFELGRSEKVRALNALRREFGYGGMIHLFKNYVLRQDQTQVANVIAKMGGINTVISRYSALNLSNDEEAALDDIRKVVGAYFKNLIVAETLNEQGKNPTEIDQLVKVDDFPAINALTILEQNAERDFKTSEPILSRPHLLAKLRKSLGYNGMIHHFKNFILRQGQERVTATKNHLDVAKGVLALYAGHSLNAAESKAVMDILNVVNAYSKALSEAIRLTAEDKLPRAIDEAVIVDDGPAFQGFNILAREFTSQSEREARHVKNSLAIVTSASMVTAWATSIIILALIAATIWLFRRQIVRPISMMTNTMTALAAGNLEVPIHEAGRNNEIGAMARSVEVFKTNAKALRDAHDVLEQHVLDRTKALQDSEARFRSLIEASPSRITLKDLDGRYLLVNKAFADHRSATIEDMLGKSVFDYMS